MYDRLFKNVNTMDFQFLVIKFSGRFSQNILSLLGCYCIQITNSLAVHICDQGKKAGCQDVCEKDGDEKYKCKCTPKSEFKLAPDNHNCVKSKCPLTVHV